MMFPFRYDGDFSKYAMIFSHYLYQKTNSNLLKLRVTNETLKIVNAATRDKVA